MKQIESLGERRIVKIITRHICGHVLPRFVFAKNVKGIPAMVRKGHEYWRTQLCPFCHGRVEN